MGFKTCQFVQNYVVYATSLLVLIILSYSLSTIYFASKKEAKDDAGLVEDYAFIADNELDAIKYNRFKTALGRTNHFRISKDSRRRESHQELPTDHREHVQEKLKDGAIQGNKCICSMRNDRMKYFHLITTNKLYMTVYVSAIIGTLAVALCVASSLGLRRWLQV